MEFISEAVVTVFSSERSPGSVRRAVLENSRKFQRKNRWQCIFLKKLANKTPHKGWFPGIFLKYFRSAISKNTWWLLLRLSGKAVVTFFVLRSGCSELADNCPEKPEKTPRKTSAEVHFSILRNKKHSPWTFSWKVFREIICRDSLGRLSFC